MTDHNNRVRNHFDQDHNAKIRPPLEDVEIDEPTSMKYKISGDPSNGCVIIAFPAPVKYFVMTTLQGFRLHDIVEEMTKHAAEMDPNVLPKEDTNYAVHAESAAGAVADELVLVRDTLQEAQRKLRELEDTTDPILEVINCLPDPPSTDWGWGPVGRLNYAIASAGESMDELAELTNVGVAQAIETSAFHSFTDMSRRVTKAKAFLKDGHPDNALAALEG